MGFKIARRSSATTHAQSRSNIFAYYDHTPLLTQHAPRLPSPTNPSNKEEEIAIPFPSSRTAAEGPHSPRRPRHFFQILSLHYQPSPPPPSAHYILIPTPFARPVVVVVIVEDGAHSVCSIYLFSTIVVDVLWSLLCLVELIVVVDELDVGDGRIRVLDVICGGLEVMEVAGHNEEKRDGGWWDGVVGLVVECDLKATARIYRAADDIQAPVRRARPAHQPTSSATAPATTKTYKGLRQRASPTQLNRVLTSRPIRNRQRRRLTHKPGLTTPTMNAPASEVALRLLKLLQHSRITGNTGQHSACAAQLPRGRAHSKERGKEEEEDLRVLMLKGGGEESTRASLWHHHGVSIPSPSPPLPLFLLPRSSAWQEEGKAYLLLLNSYTDCAISKATARLTLRYSVPTAAHVQSVVDMLWSSPCFVEQCVQG
ncbi:hypothetical protein D9611_012595 [Ephemerocybe angulata]|uniref:Uncharacterized protein n=1 Tax=Ephemerocybe angulata TaxID=980116 RepID=A0A8H5AWB3_9AGAR|nr:hypothetical protein D9611_012595 [Tulosesus angulatus]